jgi:hypothetical protein
MLLLGPLLRCNKANVDMFGGAALEQRFAGSANSRHVSDRDNGPIIRGEDLVGVGVGQCCDGRRWEGEVQVQVVVEVGSGSGRFEEAS